MKAKLVATSLVLHFFCTSCCLGFTPWLEQTFSLLNFDNTDRARLKQELLQKCREANVQRSTIEGIMTQLEPLSPVKATAASPLLQKKWMLQWTTEKEINFFSDKGISAPDSIYQVIDGALLENNIPLSRGGSFGVKGELSIPAIAGTRTNFVFMEATLDVGQWGIYKFPPVGQGWFETIYLDDSLRIDVNSRNDILICTPEA